MWPCACGSLNIPTFRTKLQILELQTFNFAPEVNALPLSSKQSAHIRTNTNKFRLIFANKFKNYRKYLFFHQILLTKLSIQHTLLSGKQKTLHLLEVLALGPLDRRIAKSGNRQRSSLPTGVRKARSPRRQIPLGRNNPLKVYLVCGHPPKSGSGHGHQMCRPLHIWCAAATPYHAAVGGRKAGVV